MKRLLSLLLTFSLAFSARAGDVKIAYAASSAVTITLDSLASSSTFVAGRESTAVDNSTNKYIDFLLAGQIPQGTSPTTGKEIRVYVVGLSNDSTWPDVFDGTDSAETVTTTNILDSAARLAVVMNTTATSDEVNWFGPVSVASLFNGKVPLKWVAFVAHNTAVNLKSSGAVLSITPVYLTSN